MITLKQLRQIDPELEHLTDVELEVVRAELYDLANIAFDLCQVQKGSKNPRGLLSDEVIKDIV